MPRTQSQMRCSSRPAGQPDLKGRVFPPTVRADGPFARPCGPSIQTVRTGGPRGGQSALTVRLAHFSACHLQNAPLHSTAAPRSTVCGARKELNLVLRQNLLGFCVTGARGCPCVDQVCTSGRDLPTLKIWQQDFKFLGTVAAARRIHVGMVAKATRRNASNLPRFGAREQLNFSQGPVAHDLARRHLSLHGTP